MNAPLCALPNELLLLIVDFVEDKRDLRALAQVSKRYQNFAESVLYRSTLIRNSTQSAQLRNALLGRPARAAWIQSINLRPGWYQSRKTLGTHMHYVISKCPNLKEFAVESPTCNYGRWASGEDAWKHDEQAILEGLAVLDPSQLSKLTLHLDGNHDRYWDPNHVGAAQYSWAMVMALPSLVELTVSCALIHDNIAIGKQHSGNLKILELVECNITLEGLMRMLAAPKALQRLHLGENAYHAGQGYDQIRGQRFNSLFGYDPTSFIKALAQQCGSLEQLEYVAGEPKFPSKSVNESFENFLKLREVHLSEHVRDNCRELILTGAPALQKVYIEVAALKLFEPLIRLEEEQHVGPGKVQSELVEKRLGTNIHDALFAEMQNRTHPSLQELHVIMPHGPVPISGSRRTWIQMLAKHWKSRGVTLFLYYKHSTSIFPPILFNETGRAPRDILMFSQEGGFTEAANGPDPWGFDSDYSIELADQFPDMVDFLDFDTFWHAEDDWDAFGDLDFHASFGL
ncbi:uncharacterized protein PV09_03720 [Verruconis gallopava]|uniref:F-box domain-containing protein n=1 Tax=Verruconis gallopava TaxID=253628 RepID=A0A0D2B1F9_9PEZI|nr:uncharacterized protein PV09_03720 [Verruconis gallopava]KIW05169.1 hypothetical protein PV09_03720 [Verruconis gallopava]